MLENLSFEAEATTHIVAVMRQLQLSPRRWMSSVEQPDAVVAAGKSLSSLMTPAVHDCCSR